MRCGSVFLRALGVLAWVVPMAVAPASATFSGLLVVPTADTVPDKAFSLEAQTDGDLGAACPHCALLNTEFGVGGRSEVGLDLDLSRQATTPFLLNGKYTVARSANGRYAGSVGAYGVGARLRPIYYAAGTADFGGVRLHAGPMVIERQAQAFVGVDKSLFGKLDLMADYTTGPYGMGSAGANYQVTSRFAVMAGAVFPNTAAETDFPVHFVYTGLYAR